MFWPAMIFEKWLTWRFIYHVFLDNMWQEWGKQQQVDEWRHFERKSIFCGRMCLPPDYTASMWCDVPYGNKTSIDNKAHVTSPGPLAGGFDVWSLDTRAAFTFRHYLHSPCRMIRTQASSRSKYSWESYSVLKGQYTQNWNATYLLLPSMLMEVHKG